jgi:hypothetical protein
MSGKWKNGVLMVAMALGGAGMAVGGMVMGARAAGREDVGVHQTVSESESESENVSESGRVSESAVATSTSTSVSPAIPAPRPRPQPSGSFSIRRMQVTSGIDQREPIDHPSRFGDSDERVYAFVEASNPTDEPRELLVTFENGQRSTGHVTLTVPAHMPRFRTWAWTRLSRSPGEWTAEIHDGDQVVASDEFEIR